MYVHAAVCIKLRFYYVHKYVHVCVHKYSVNAGCMKRIKPLFGYHKLTYSASTYITYLFDHE